MAYNMWIEVRPICVFGSLHLNLFPCTDRFDSFCRGTVHVASSRKCRPDRVVVMLEGVCELVFGSDVFELSRRSVVRIVKHVQNQPVTIAHQV